MNDIIDSEWDFIFILDFERIFNDIVIIVEVMDFDDLSSDFELVFIDEDADWLVGFYQVGFKLVF